MGKIIGIILLFVIVFLLSGLFYWGLGALICWAFNIAFEWTFIHGIIVSLIVGIFTSSIKIHLDN